LDTPPLWICFLVYGQVFGIPLILFLLIVYPPRFLIIACGKVPSKNLPENVLTCNDLKNQLIELGKVVKTKIYWAFILNAACLVVYGYFWIPLIVPHMAWHGADIDTAYQYNFVFAYLLPFGGVFAFILGFVIKNKTSLCVALASQFFTVAILGVTSTISGPLWVQYISFVLLIMWRMNGFVISMSVIGLAYPSPNVAGKAIGFLCSVSGIIGIVLNRYLAELVISDSWWFFPIHISCSCLGALAALVLGILVVTDLDNECVCVIWKKRTRLQ